MIKLILTLGLFVAIANAKSVRFEKMPQGQGASEDDSKSALQQDFPTILDSKLKSSDNMQADSNSTRQSGVDYPTACGSAKASTAALKAVKEAFGLHSPKTESGRFSIISNAKDSYRKHGKTVNSVLVLPNVGGWAFVGQGECVSFQRYTVWFFY